MPKRAQSSKKSKSRKQIEEEQISSARSPSRGRSISLSPETPMLQEYRGYFTFTGAIYSIKRVFYRLALFITFMFLWFKSQEFLSQYQDKNQKGVGDLIHVAVFPITEYLHDTNPAAADVLLASSSFFIDVFAMTMIIHGLLWNFRFIIALLFTFVVRQVAQVICTLPQPDMMIWRQPKVLGYEFPSLLVTYETGSDFFPSGHTSIAVCVAVEMARNFGKFGKILGFSFAAFEITTVLVTRAHYSMDVITGYFCARVGTLLAHSWLMRLNKYLPTEMQERAN